MEASTCFFWAGFVLFLGAILVFTKKVPTEKPSQLQNNKEAEGYSKHSVLMQKLNKIEEVVKELEQRPKAVSQNFIENLIQSKMITAVKAHEAQIEQAKLNWSMTEKKLQDQLDYHVKIQAKLQSDWRTTYTNRIDDLESEVEGAMNLARTAETIAHSAKMDNLRRPQRKRIDIVSYDGGKIEKKVVNSGNQDAMKKIAKQMEQLS